jgi:hypothetical protein
MHLIVLLCLAQLTAASPSGDAIEYLSPDRTLRAAIIAAHRPKLQATESIVEIRDSSGTLLSRKDYSSDDGEHGAGVDKASWTSDSKFFVYIMTLTGGHQPWHSPIDVFTRADNRIRSLDQYVGAITGGFELRPPDRIKVKVLKREVDTVEVDIRLSTVFNKTAKKVKPN